MVTLYKRKKIFINEILLGNLKDIKNTQILHIYDILIFNPQVKTKANII